MSRHAACEAPSFSCTVHAIDGRMRSGVTVPTKMWSTSWTVRPAISSARVAAANARSELSWPSATMRRSRMPVRVTIHSSEVSTIFSRSKFDRIRSGSALPVPTIVAPRSWLGLGIGVSQELLDVLVHALLHERGRRPETAPDGARGRASVPDEDHSVDPEQRRSAVLGVVELLPQAVERRLEHQRAQLRAQALADLPLEAA